MAEKTKQSAYTLTEMLVVMSILAVLFSIGAMSAKKLLSSFESGGQIKSVVSSALVNARAIAVSQRKYAGVRFQEDLNGHQYMVFIIHDQAATGFANGFRAMEGKKPVRLPMSVKLRHNAADLNSTLFSCIFAPSGRLVIHSVRTAKNKNIKDGDGNFADTVFNTHQRVVQALSLLEEDSADIDSVSFFYLGDKNSPGELCSINQHTGRIIFR